jgi:hypothetical protein
MNTMFGRGGLSASAAAPAVLGLSKAIRERTEARCRPIVRADAPHRRILRQAPSRRFIALALPAFGRTVSRRHVETKQQGHPERPILASAAAKGMGHPAESTER